MMRLKLYGLIFFIMYMIANNAFAAIKKPLPAEQAFKFSTQVENNTVFAKWEIAPGYYLYKQHLHIKVTPKTPTKIIYPPSQLKRYANHRYEIYAGNLTVPITLQSQEKIGQLNIDYQGCSQYGFCYPPMHKTVKFDLSNTHSASTSLLNNQYKVQNFLEIKSTGGILFFFLGLGLFLAFTPCILPMIPILTSLIVGQKNKLNTKKAFMLSLTYVLGSAMTYAIAGVIAASMGRSLQVWLQQPWAIATVSTLFVLLALSLFGVYELRLPRHWQQRMLGWSNQQQSGTYVGVMVMGMLSALMVSPCITAPFVGVLMYIAETGNKTLGASALFALGMGMGIPLLFIGTSAGKWLPKSGVWMEAVKQAFGVLMLAMAIWMLDRIIPAKISVMLWGLFLIGVALFFILRLPHLIGRRELNRILGFVIGTYGVLLMIGGVGTYGTQLLTVNNRTASTFIIVHTVAEAEKQLILAEAASRPAILDFYADWCEACVSMEYKVFNSPIVQKKLADYVLLRADLSANSADDEALLKHFNVIAPPTVLFFNTQGREIASQRIVGEVNEKEFLEQLQQK